MFSVRAGDGDALEASALVEGSVEGDFEEALCEAELDALEAGRRWS